MATVGRKRAYPEGTMVQFQVTALPRQIKSWDEAAKAAGLSRPAWMRLACDRRVADAARRKK